jgi:glycosyltransferase involved in cell wall biosynthesis
VLRNSAGYVRGYLSYLSFDIPLFFRLLGMRRADLVLVEPPPTTGVVVRVAAWLRRVPYVYDAADLWSDAAVTTTNSRLVLRVLRAAERFAIRGARHAFVVAQAYSDRMRAIGIRTPTTVTGFGVDNDTFDYLPAAAPSNPIFVYGGSYSEWHGADIFVTAFARFASRHPGARLLFVGNGSERPALTQLAVTLGVRDRVEFRDPVPGPDLAVTLSEATASLASLKPGLGYDYAFATKVYSSLAVGCPVIFTGAGPAGPFMRDAAEQVRAGTAVDYDVSAVVAAMEQLTSNPPSPDDRRAVSTWTRTEHSMRAVARRVVASATAALRL